MQRGGAAEAGSAAGLAAPCPFPHPPPQPHSAASPAHPNNHPHPTPLPPPPTLHQAAENVRALMDALPPMRPLVMVLKVFLQQRELNEVRLSA